MSNLNSKVAYITGGSKGIGFGIAKTLVDNGIRVAITSRSISSAKEAAQSLSNDASRVLALESNVTSLASEIKAVKAVVDYFGKLDVAVANAGVGHFAPIDTITEKDWKETIDTNHKSQRGGIEE